MISAKDKKFTKPITNYSTDIKDAPGVTIGIPVLNEEDHIERVVSGFLNTGYPNLVEILVADGGSTDRTREIVQELSEKDERVKLVDNPERYQSFALNHMIEQAEGEIFLRADAHCDYGNDYIGLCIEKLHQDKVRNAGGAARFLATNLVQAGTAIAVLSVMGNGGAKHYNPEYEGYADTVPMGCFWTKDLRKLNGFTESNHTNEDAEINYRIQKVLGGKIFISPEIKLWYYPRKKLSHLFNQYFRYGRGRFLTSSMHEGKIPFRSKAPFIFVGAMILLLMIDHLFLNGILGSNYILGAAIFILLFESFRLVSKKRTYFINEVWKNKKSPPPSSISLGVFTFLALIVMLIAHFSGYGYQLIKNRIINHSGW